MNAPATSGAGALNGRVTMWLARAGAGALATIMVLTFCDVIGRYVFNAPIVGTVEVTELLMGMMVYLAVGVDHTCPRSHSGRYYHRPAAGPGSGHSQRPHAGDQHRAGLAGVLASVGSGPGCRREERPDPNLGMADLACRLCHGGGEPSHRDVDAAAARPSRAGFGRGVAQHP